MSNEFPVWYFCQLYFPSKFCFDMILWHDHLALVRKQRTPHCESSIGDDGMICITEQRHISSSNKIKGVLFDIIKIEILISIQKFISTIFIQKNYAGWTYLPIVPGDEMSWFPG